MGEIGSYIVLPNTLDGWIPQW